MIVRTDVKRSDLSRYECTELSKALNLPPIVSAILVSRGVDTVKKASSFLGDEGDGMYSPFLMKDMDRAANRVINALKNHEKILIYGDYDADGITASSLTYLYLKEKNADCLVHIPDRFTEGYGISKKVLEEAASNGVRLIVTVDNGSKAVREIAYAAELGMDTVVTDHHECGDILPSCAAVVNPMRGDCSYPFKGLAGVGVAFKLICAVETLLTADAETSVCRIFNAYADLISVGTVADVMPLTSENRVIVKKGLKLINMGKRLGIRSLLSAIARAKGKSPRVDVSSIGFQIAPRINASGRMANGTISFDLLTADDTKKADQLSQTLCALNEERQKVENRIFAEARAQLTASEEDRILVLWGEGWHEGVIGIAAARICEQTGKPTIMISVNGEQAKGSCRSCGGCSIVSLLLSCADLLDRFGGHESAAGLGLKTENITAFKERILSLCAGKDFTVDADIRSAVFEPEPEELSIELASSLSLLEPFGNENESPIFYMRDLTIESVFALSGGKHTKLTCRKNGLLFLALCFGQRTCAFPFSTGDRIDLLFELSINEFRDTKSLQLIVREYGFPEDGYGKYKDAARALHEIKSGAFADPPCSLPTLDDCRQLYKLLKKLEISDNTASCAYVLTQLPFLTPVKLYAALDAFEETGVADIRFDSQKPIFTFELPKIAQKADLLSASVFACGKRQRNY